MTKKEQRAFVRDLTKSIQGTVLTHIDRGHIPSQWDGNELRRFIADMTQASVFPISESRMRDYNSTVAMMPGV